MTKKAREKEKKRFLEILEKKNGVFNDACKEIGITNVSVYRWRRADEVFDAAVDEIQVSLLGDHAESVVAHAITDQKSLKAAMFYLQARNRKYQNRTAVEVTDPVKVQLFLPKNARDNNKATTGLPDSDVVEPSRHSIRRRRSRSR